MKKNYNLEEIIKFTSVTIKKKLPKVKVYLYGSRAKGRGGKFSDIDIGILGKDKILARKLFEIEDEIEKTGTLYEINIVDLLKTSEKFRTGVLSYAKEI